jgi:glucoamylase
MLRLMEAAATETGLIPEQVWDADDIPEKGLFRGRPTTSAGPLAWAHAEYVKLLRSVRDGAVFDRPEQTVLRYGTGYTRPLTRVWRFNHKFKELPAGHTLRVELLEPAVVRWRAGRGAATQEVNTADTGLGLHVADLPTDRLSAGSAVAVTLHRTAAGKRDETVFKIAVVKSDDTGSAR